MYDEECGAACFAVFGGSAASLPNWNDCFDSLVQLLELCAP